MSQGTKPVLPCGLAAKRQVYNNYRTRAARISVPFTLTFEEFLAFTLLPCYYCGKPPSNLMKADIRNKEKGDDFIYQGVDRADNTDGYTRGNAVPCCPACNKMKGTMDHIQFMSRIMRIYKYSVEVYKGALEVYQGIKKNG